MFNIKESFDLDMRLYIGCMSQEELIEAIKKKSNWLVYIENEEYRNLIKLLAGI